MFILNLNPIVARQNKGGREGGKERGRERKREREMACRDKSRCSAAEAIESGNNNTAAEKEMESRQIRADFKGRADRHNTHLSILLQLALHFSITQRG